ncbi:putative amidophosphoribosyltransferase [Rhodoglobus vestalii]|uniref:Putative amidophosphoribosyltransferase n=2 Tax=Rhodoglobus vestalii TaxID=193384 RepID=A0A8H2PZL0_9MICO|nr:putative amidophosphoribosyltransferase [Rhodoglobus vestalii]
MREAVRDAWAVVMPVECAGCETPDRALCPECARSLVAVPTIHSTPQHVRVYAAVRYEAVVRRVLLAFKNQHRTDQARSLARLLAPALHRAIADTTADTNAESIGGGRGEAAALIVAVPTSKRAFRSRGYDPLKLVLGAAGIRHQPILRAVKKTASQKHLGAQQRAINVQGAFVATRWLGSTRVIIVDDVLTTGATIDEAARAISAAGGTVIAAATIGFTPRTGASRDFASGED